MKLGWDSMKNIASIALGCVLAIAIELGKTSALEIVVFCAIVLGFFAAMLSVMS